MPRSLQILNEALCLNEDLEIPFPKAMSLAKIDQSDPSSTSASHTNDLEKTDEVHDCKTNGAVEETTVKSTATNENPFDESIPFKLDHMKMHVC